MKTLEQFQHEMWLQNCDERTAWSQPISTEANYIRENETYLQEEYFTLYLSAYLEEVQ
tara:strand:+ start:40 stop:213 length:174 start_codon:yes stop_codon:yes gene_type:complete